MQARLSYDLLAFAVSIQILVGNVHLETVHVQMVWKVASSIS